MSTKKKVPSDFGLFTIVNFDGDQLDATNDVKYATDLAQTEVMDEDDCPGDTIAVYKLYAVYKRPSNPKAIKVY